MTFINMLHSIAPYRSLVRGVGLIIYTLSPLAVASNLLISYRDFALLYELALVDYSDSFDCVYISSASRSS
eukprot:SAG11_NODE_2895_length_2856_cov_2.924946_1_plen_71_part_00